MELLSRGAVDLVDEAQLRAKLERSARSGLPLTVKTGFDPSSPDLHLGHTVLLRKMRHFQQLGHRVVFLIGDFTALIGDPTGKKTTRPQLTPEEVEANAQTYKRQVWKVLDEQATVVDYNSRWLLALGSVGLVRLAGRYTLARMMEREDFRTRFEQKRPIHLHELLYPLAQGYDSVALAADVELGGHDQIFNLLVGRDLMKEEGLEPQVVLTVPLLVGTDGSEKMSKTLGNAIAVEDPPDEIYGKTMSIPDALMWDWYLLLTDLPRVEIERRRAAVAAGELHPKRIKQELARRLTADYHGEEAARRAEAEFEKVFTAGGMPQEVPDHAIDGSRPLLKLLADAGLAPSNAEARRLVEQGAVAIDGARAADPFHELPPRAEPYLFKVGKRRFARILIRTVTLAVGLTFAVTPAATPAPAATLAPAATPAAAPAPAAAAARTPTAPAPAAPTAAPPAAAGPIHPLRASTAALGARLEIEVRDLPRDVAGAALQAAVAEVAEVERMTDPGRPYGELAALNAAAGKGPRRVDPRLFAALSRALDFCVWSEGKEGPLGRALHRLWGRGSEAALAAAPSPDQLRDATEAASCKRLVVDPRKQTVALAAGSALDLVDFSAPLGRIFLRDQSLALAARDERPLHVAAQVLSPFIDQRSGEPAAEGVLVTLAVSDLALDAQALAATMTITGTQEGELLTGSIRPRPSILWLMGSGNGVPLLVDYRWTEVAKR